MAQPGPYAVCKVIFMPVQPLSKLVVLLIFIHLTVIHLPAAVL